jgi:hypothetical protein
MEQLRAIQVELKQLKEMLPPDDRMVIEVMEHLVVGFRSLCNWVRSSLDGDTHADRFLNAARAQAIVASEHLSSNRFPLFAEAARKAISLMENVSDLRELKSIALQIQHIPVPAFELAVDRPWGPPQLGNDATPEAPMRSEGPFVIKVMFEIDHNPWSAPQILLANTIYDLNARVTVPKWPTGADELLIDYIATLDPAHYKISPLRIVRPEADTACEFNLAGHAEFPIAQSILSEPISIQVRATFLSSVDPEMHLPTTVVGYYQLRVYVSDMEHTPLLARYRSIDARNLEIITELRRSLPNLDPEHLHDFVDALGAVTNYLGISLQEARYQEGNVIRESDFQKHLLHHMRTKLGQDVQEAPRQGGGPTDIQYRSVTIELKVEKDVSDRRKMIERYLAQPTQYSSAGGAQLGILCILDLTEKHSPPASPQNQITLETPALHGFEESNAPFPTKAAVVVIDGNLRLPSSYSR